MFTRTLTLSILASCFLNAATIPQLIELSYEKNYELKRLEELNKSKNVDEELSTKYSNPILGLGLNDILFSSEFPRDREPMQAEFVTITQKIPLSDRLDISKEIAINNTNSNLYSIADYKSKISSLIYEISYKIITNKKEIELTNKYLENVDKLRSYENIYYESKSAQSDELINLDILKENKKINIETLKIENSILLEKLQRVVNAPVDDIEADLEFLNIEDEEFIDINKHPFISNLALTVKNNEKTAQLENEKKLDDLSVTVGYFHRTSYEDYANFAVAIPLPIYGSENLNVIKAKSQASASSIKLDDTKKEFDAQIKILNLELKRAKQNYALVENKIIKTKQELSSFYESTNEISNNTKKIITNENEIIDMQIKALDWKRKYFDSYSKLVYFEGVSK